MSKVDYTITNNKLIIPEYNFVFHHEQPSDVQIYKKEFNYGLIVLFKSGNYTYRYHNNTLIARWKD